VDSVERITEESLQAVRDIYGDPEVWGRYLHDEGKASTADPRGIVESELEVVRQNNLLVLVIDYNPGTDELIGYQKGRDSADMAVRNAQRLGIRRTGWHRYALGPNLSILSPEEQVDLMGRWADSGNHSTTSGRWCCTRSPKAGVSHASTTKRC
jgi:hypothetical protein